MAPSAAAVASAPAPQDARLGWQGPGGTTTPLLGSRLVHKLHNWPWRTGWMARPCPVSAGVGGLGGGATKGSSPRGEKWRGVGSSPLPQLQSCVLLAASPHHSGVFPFPSLPPGPTGLEVYSWCSDQLRASQQPLGEGQSFCGEGGRLLSGEQGPFSGPGGGALGGAVPGGGTALYSLTPSPSWALSPGK